ncbi:MAG TPA: chondroitinase-B domain-containing protein [Candidatus Limnocylindrales bacterium]
MRIALRAMLTGALTLSLITLPATAAHAATVTVTSVPDLVAAVAAANPGDTVLLANGTYANAGAFTLTNTKPNPSNLRITIGAANRGKAVFTGDTRITFLSSNYLTFRDFFFDEALNASGNVITVDGTSFTQITNNYFYHSGNTVSPFARVIHIHNRSKNNEINRNTFENPQGTPITVRDHPADLNVDDQNTNNWIHHNMFKNGKYTLDAYPGLTDNNGMEAIQTGVGGGLPVEQFSLIEHNLFQNYTGDSAEIISNKSSKNTIRYNTFRNNQSGVTLRGGDDVRFDGNFLLGMPAGLRVFGMRHIITNNYFANGFSGIVMPTGVLPANQVSIDSKVVNNTFVNNTDTQLLIGSTGTTNDQPQNTLVANNLIVANRGTAIRTGGTVETNTTYSRNILHLSGTAQAGTADAGITLANPNLVVDGELSRPATGSVAVDFGQAVAGVSVTDDIDGQARVGNPDAGCDEVSTAALVRVPYKLSSSLVRVNWAVGDAWVISTDQHEPAAPANLRVTSVTQNSVTVAWDAATDNVGVTSYEVFTGSNSVTARDSLGTTSATSFTVNGLTPATGIRLSVRASDAARNVSFPSAVIIATTAA